MSIIIAYAVSVLLSIGVITPNSVNSGSTSLCVEQRQGKTIVVDSISGHEIIIAL